MNENLFIYCQRKAMHSIAEQVANKDGIHLDKDKHKGKNKIKY